MTCSVKNQLSTRLARNATRLGVVAAIAVALVTATAISAPPPASAATGYTAMSYCFKFAENGHPYNYETYLQAYFNGSWQNVSSQRAGINGCGTYAAPNGYYWRVRAYTRGTNYQFSGTTGYRWASGGSIHLGTWWVY
jgi:hypothetical protein